MFNRRVQPGRTHEYFNNWSVTAYAICAIAG